MFSLPKGITIPLHSKQTKSKGWYLTATRKLEERSLPISPPAADEVQIKIKSVTLSVPDHQLYRKGQTSDAPLSEPLVLGHEGAGVVVAVGARVTDLKEGDSVVINGDVPCGNCKFCNKDMVNLCTGLKIRGSVTTKPAFHGLCQELVNHPAKQVHKLESSGTTISFKDAAIIDPLACSIHAVQRARSIRKGGNNTVAIYGAGVMGCLISAVVLSLGGNVLIMDTNKNRVDFAMRHKFATSGSVIGLASGSDLVTQHFGGQAEVVFECTGAVAAMADAVQAVQAGGEIVVIGHRPPQYTPPLRELAPRELSLVTTSRHGDNYMDAMRLIREGGFAYSEIISYTFKGFESVPEAFECALGDHDGKESTTKAKFGPEGIYRLRIEF